MDYQLRIGQGLQGYRLYMLNESDDAFPELVGGMNASRTAKRSCMTCAMSPPE